MTPTSDFITDARLMKASDDELSKSFVNVVLRDLKLRFTVVTSTVVALVVLVVCREFIVVDVVANMVVLLMVGASDIEVDDVDLSLLVVTRVDFGDAVIV